MGFLESQKYQPIVWYCYIDDIFFVQYHGESELLKFLTDLNNFHQILKSIHGHDKKKYIVFRFGCEYFYWETFQTLP